MHWSSSTVREKLTTLITRQDPNEHNQTFQPGTENRGQICQLHSQHINPSCCHSNRGEGSYSERQKTSNGDWHFLIRPRAWDKQLPKPTRCHLRHTPELPKPPSVAKYGFPVLTAPWRKPLAAASPARPTWIGQGHVDMSELQAGPWVDCCGPLPTGEYLPVITDEYSWYPVMEVMRSASAQTVILYADKDFAIYLRNCGINNRKIIPLWFQAKIQAGSLKPLFKAVRNATAE